MHDVSLAALSAPLCSPVPHPHDESLHANRDQYHRMFPIGTPRRAAMTVAVEQRSEAGVGLCGRRAPSNVWRVVDSVARVGRSGWPLSCVLCLSDISQRPHVRVLCLLFREGIQRRVMTRRSQRHKRLGFTRRLPMTLEVSEPQWKVPRSTHTHTVPSVRGRSRVGSAIQSWPTTCLFLFCLWRLLVSET